MKWEFPILAEPPRKEKKLIGRMAFGPFGALSNTIYEERLFDAIFTRGDFNDAKLCRLVGTAEKMEARCRTRCFYWILQRPHREPSLLFSIGELGSGYWSVG